MTENVMMDDTLSMLRQLGLLTDLDLHFARLLVRLTSGDPSENSPLQQGRGLGARASLALAAALASRATGQGDVCVNLRQWARRAQWDTKMVETSASIPPAGEWLSAVRASRYT